MKRSVLQLVAIAALVILAPAPASAQPTAETIFHTDRGAFRAIAPGLPVEDFTGTNIDAGAFGACPPPLDSSTDDSCFPPGGVLDGFELDILLQCLPFVGSSGNYAVPTAGFLGLPVTAVGPEFFCDSTILRFDPPVTAAGFELYEFQTPVNADITVFDAQGEVLGTDTAVGSTTGAFWGVTSAVAVARIEIVAASDGNELLTNLEFGQAESLLSIPALSGFGTVLLCVLLAVAGLAAITLRR